ncbi:hypothetical protein EV127DRAFT_410267 [Xylaria flabelliformis]|nr:hypothetical protein EV127DRAFT_410267 [Xylaria flabelliformis]
MKNFGAILMILAAGASLGAALPASNIEHGPVARGQPYYALHVREPKRGKDGQNGQDNGNANNGTLVADPANNGTANGNDNGKGNGKGHKGKGNGQDNAGNNGGDAGILEALLGLLGGAAGGQGAGNQPAAQAQGQKDPLAILQGLLNGA